MRSFHIASVALVALLVACGGAVRGEDGEVAVEPAGVDPESAPLGPHGAPEPGAAPMLGLHHSKDAGATRKAPGNMTWHRGAIMTDSVVKTIFWGSSFAPASVTAATTAKMDGLNRFYAGLASATGYLASNTEYTGTNGRVGTSVTYVGTSTDAAAAPTGAPATTAILAEVCKVLAVPGNGPPVANGYYPVYTDAKRGGAGYCAWHSYGTCAGVPVQFAFFFDLDGDTGCDPQDTTTGHSQGLAALASVSAHEWSETVTDPRDGGWWDAAGNENSDKCAWSFPPTNQTIVDPATGLAESWKIQGNWSNAAFTAGTGYKNRDGQSGCMPNN